MTIDDRKLDELNYED